MIIERKYIQFILPIILLISGIYLVPIKILGPNLTRLPGDMGDSRFNNYILEHGYKYIKGEEISFWDAPMMYPYKKVTAFSDNLLGTMPIYGIYRSTGFDRETAYQLWIITLFGLNFICCYLALFRWSNTNILSATAAYIFAFGIYNIGHLEHVQVLPRFISPLVVYWVWTYISKRDIRYLIYSVSGIVYQFYCGIYLGFFLVYSIILFIIAYYAIYRDLQIQKSIRNIKEISYILVIIGIGGLLLYLLIRPYYEIHKVTGLTKYNEILTTVPKPISYFFTHTGARNWKILTQHSQYAFPNWWNHFHFIGGLPWIAILMSLIILIKKEREKGRKNFIEFLLLALGLNILFCINTGGVTLYRIIYELPGFNSLRSVDRIMNIQIIFFLIVFIFVFKEIVNKNRVFQKILIILPAIAIAENYIEASHLKRFEKSESQKKVKEIEKNILVQYDKKYKAIAYMPVISKPEEPEKQYKTVELNVSCILAAQTLNIPIVNAYTGYNPGEFNSYFNNMDKNSLNEWCNYTRIKTEDIQQINDFGEKVIRTNTINLIASNGKYVCNDLTRKNKLIADKEHSYSWETFTLIEFKNGRSCIISFENKFVSAQISSTNEIIADRIKLKEWELFRIQNTDENHIAIKAANGNYITIDNKTGQLFSSSKNVDKNEIFKVIYNYGE